MRLPHRWCLHLVALAALAGCEPAIEPPPAPEPTPQPVIQPADLEPDAPILKEDEVPKVIASPTPVVAESEKPAVVLPSPPPLTAAGKQLLLSSGGRELVLEFETGGKSGYDPRPEAPDARLSGVTWGIGYDGHFNSPTVIRMDWMGLGQKPADRLAAMHPYYGRTAQQHVGEVRDILVTWTLATQVFDQVDVAREFANAKRAMPGFADLRPNAQAAIISVGFNRGWGFSGPNRVEWRAIRDLVPNRDYEQIASELRKMVRVWKGTQIERGMTRRRLAEAKLVLIP